MKIAIGVPSGDMLHADFAMALINLTAISSRQGIQLAIINQRSSIVEIGRNEIVEKARSIKADKLFWLDSDMFFPPDTLIKLLDHKKDIICCDAVRRKPPFTSVVQTIHGKPIDYKNTDPLVQLKGATLACTLTDMKVFDKIKRPYFLVTYNDKNTFLGEDYYFSNLVRSKGLNIWCDTKLSKEIGHIGTTIYYLKTEG